jgi:tRNA U34 5-carboxymethylaminomethyl modifying GTPase MnmE/TrmE
MTWHPPDDRDEKQIANEDTAGIREAATTVEVIGLTSSQLRFESRT